MIMYLDTGILVKLVSHDSELRAAYLGSANFTGHSLVTSELAFVEVKSALFAKGTGVAALSPGGA